MGNTTKQICVKFSTSNSHHCRFEHHSKMFLLSFGKFQSEKSDIRPVSLAYKVHVHLLALYKTYKRVEYPTLYVCDLVDLLLILGRSTGAEALKKNMVTHDLLKDFSFALEPMPSQYLTKLNFSCPIFTRERLYTSHVFHQTSSNSLSHFCSVRRQEVFLTPSPGWDGSTSQGYPPALNSLVPIYTPGWREAL